MAFNKKEYLRLWRIKNKERIKEYHKKYKARLKGETLEKAKMENVKND